MSKMKTGRYSAPEKLRMETFVPIVEQKEDVPEEGGLLAVALAVLGIVVFTAILACVMIQVSNYLDRRHIIPTMGAVENIHIRIHYDD